MAIAMRAPDGSIAAHTEKLAEVYRVASPIPFLRGVILLWDALGLGMRALTISANMQTGEDEKLEGPRSILRWGYRSCSAWPLLCGPCGGGRSSNSLSAGASWGHLLEGVLRLGLLIGYIWLIGFMPDVSRLFGYHGAEHKTINAFEAGAELTPENVAVPAGAPALRDSLPADAGSVLDHRLLAAWPAADRARLLSRILFIPVLAGVAVEYIRWTANHLDYRVVRWLIKPSLALQHLTTREPDRAMLEVAITSFQTMRQAEREFAP